MKLLKTIVKRILAFIPFMMLIILVIFIRMIESIRDYTIYGFELTHFNKDVNRKSIADLYRLLDEKYNSEVEGNYPLCDKPIAEFEKTKLTGLMKALSDFIDEREYQHSTRISTIDLREFLATYSLNNKSNKL